MPALLMTAVLSLVPSAPLLELPLDRTPPQRPSAAVCLQKGDISVWGDARGTICYGGPSFGVCQDAEGSTWSGEPNPCSSTG